MICDGSIFPSRRYTTWSVARSCTSGRLGKKPKTVARNAGHGERRVLDGLPHFTPSSLGHGFADTSSTSNAPGNCGFRRMPITLE